MAVRNSLPSIVFFREMKKFEKLEMATVHRRREKFEKFEIR